MRVILLIGIMFWSMPCWAFRFSPMVVSLSPSGPGATQTFLVENNGAEKIAIQVEGYHRDEDLDGKEIRKETDEFAIFPPQLVLEPGEKRNIRLTWTGTQSPKSELPYRLVVSELPVNLKKPSLSKPGSNLTFLLQYVASVYITPNGAVPKIEVESFKSLSHEKGELVLKNSGTAHQVLRGARVFLVRGKGSEQSRVELKGEAVKAMEAENILAGKSRKFVLNLEKPLKPNETVNAEFEIETR